MNTLSRAGDDARIDEKLRLEKAFKHLNEENRLLSEKYRVSQQQNTRAEEELIKYKALISIKEQEIANLQANWRKLHEDFTNSVKEQRVLQGQNEELKRAARDQQHASTRTLGGVVQRINAKEFSVEEPNAFSSQKEFASLRNKSMSGDETQERWLHQLNDQVEKEYSERADKGTVGIRHAHEGVGVRSDQTSQADLTEKQNVTSLYNNAFPKHFQNGG